MKNLEPPKFSDITNSSGYERIAWFIFTGFLEDSLPDFIYDDLALASEELMTPLRRYAAAHRNEIEINRDVNAVLMSKAVFAIRLAHVYGDDDSLYDWLRRDFFAIDIQNSDFWMAQKKKYITATLPYFKSYRKDEVVQQEMLRYFEATRSEQVKTTVHYFGGISRWPDRFTQAITDGARRDKHWVYIWCFNAICQEGLFSEQERLRLKDVIQRYAAGNIDQLSDFEQRIISDAMGA